MKAGKRFISKFMDIQYLGNVKLVMKKLSRKLSIWHILTNSKLTT